MQAVVDFRLVVFTINDFLSFHHFKCLVVVVVVGGGGSGDGVIRNCVVVYNSDCIQLPLVRSLYSL